MEHLLNKNITLSTNRPVTLYRDGNEMSCPYAGAARPCGEWCPHFGIVDKSDMYFAGIPGTHGASPHKEVYSWYIALACTNIELPIDESQLSRAGLLVMGTQHEERG